MLVAEGFSNVFELQLNFRPKRITLDLYVIAMVNSDQHESD